MHISSFTNVDNIFILDQSRKDLKESGHVEEFRRYIKVNVLGARIFISLEVVVEPIFAISSDLC